MSHDWRDVPLPPNIECGEDCFLQSAQIFGLFHSQREPGLRMGKGSGIYSQSQLITGVSGQITLGDFACINSATLQCENAIRIGAHCLVAWGAVISDCAPVRRMSASNHHEAWGASCGELPPAIGPGSPIVLEDNVWVGFGAVIQPGVTIGEGSIVGTKTVIKEDVPPYVVVAGSPARIVRELSVQERRTELACRVGR